MQRINISRVVVSNTYLNYLCAAGKTSVFGVKWESFDCLRFNSPSVIFADNDNVMRNQVVT